MKENREMLLNILLTRYLGVNLNKLEKRNSNEMDELTDLKYNTCSLQCKHP
jgi:hypothetical protein